MSSWPFSVPELMHSDTNMSFTRSGGDAEPQIFSLSKRTLQGEAVPVFMLLLEISFTMCNPPLKSLANSRSANNKNLVFS